MLAHRAADMEAEGLRSSTHEGNGEGLPPGAAAIGCRWHYRHRSPSLWGTGGGLTASGCLCYTVDERYTVDAARRYAKQKKQALACFFCVQA